MPDLTDTTHDIGTFAVYPTGEMFLQTHPLNRRLEVEDAARAFFARGSMVPESGVYRYTLTEDGNFCPLGRAPHGPAIGRIPDETFTIHGFKSRWHGRDDMGDITVGDRITCERPDGTTVTGDAHHTSWGDWYTQGGLLLVPAADDIRWRRA